MLRNPSGYRAVDAVETVSRNAVSEQANSTVEGATVPV